MQPIRLFFPLFTSHQLITGANSAYRAEINRLRKFGLDKVAPYLPNIRLLKYPYVFKITFFVFEDNETDMVSCLTIANYILHQIETYGCIQSADYRVIPKIELQIKKVVTKFGEGCEFSFEKTTVEKPDYHF